MFWGLLQRQVRNRQRSWKYWLQWRLLLYAVALVSFTLRTGLISQPTADSFLSSGFSDAWRTQWTLVSPDDDDPDDQLALQDADQDDDSLLLLSTFTFLPFLEVGLWLSRERQALLCPLFPCLLGARSPPTPSC